VITSLTVIKIAMLVSGLVALGGCDQVFGLERDPPRPPPPQRWASVDGGADHSCGIRVNGTLWCWGRNDHGQLTELRTGADLERPEPTQVGTREDWVTVSTQASTACALTEAGELWCWGANTYGQLASPIVSPGFSDQPTQIAGSWTGVSVGGRHVCALDPLGKAWCWGSGEQGQLGANSADSSATPLPVLGDHTWKAISAGLVSNCAIDDVDQVWCWGSPDWGKLGTGPSPPVTLMPVPVVGSERYAQISLGAEFGCGVTLDRRMRCWGRGDDGQIGDGSKNERDAPTLVGQDEIVDWVEVGAGERHACARRATGDILCWGHNGSLELASEMGATRSVPTAIAQPDGAVAWIGLGLGAFHTCAIDDANQLWCAGRAGTGALGIESEGSRLAPTAISLRWTSLTAGPLVSCGVRDDGQASCWGSNSDGSLGDGTTNSVQAPPAAGVMAAVAIDASLTPCAIGPGAARTLSCWGRNEFSQVGNNSTNNQRTPVALDLMTVPASVVATNEHSCAIDSVGDLWCWGRDGDGQAAYISDPMNPTLFWPVPFRPTGGVKWTAVKVGQFHSCGIMMSGDVACWGQDATRQLGPRPNSTTGSTHSPQLVAIPPMPSPPGAVDELAVGGYHSCARVGTGVWCWGSGEYGQLGIGTTGVFSTPMQAPGSWATIGAGYNSTCGIQTNGTLWCWGANEYGQLGDGTLLQRTEPTQVGTDTNWATVDLGGNHEGTHACARKVDGSGWCWGANRYGQLGTGDAWRATFVMVPR